jgi:two-component system, cell cycle response regulator
MASPANPSESASEAPTSLRRVFLDRVPALLAALEKAIVGMELNDPEAVPAIRRIAHSLKGSAAMVGVPEVGDAATAIEADSGSLDRARVLALIDRLRLVCSQDSSETRRILVVEDDPMLRDLTITVLEGPGRTILSAGNGAEAERILVKETVDLVVLDLLLPDMDGRTLLARLQNDPKTSRVPVIVLTARMGPQPRTECLALGASNYFEKPYDPQELAAAAGGCLAREHEAEVGRKDPLTGIGNRTLLQEAWAAAAAIRRRTRQSAAVTIADLDHFKRVNDTYGHPMGDEVLRTFARVMGERLRETDTLGRWGGEEFVAILPMTDLKGAVNLMNSLLDAFREIRFEPAGHDPFVMTFSAGVVDADPRKSLEEVVAEADHFLYEAKESGRARVVSSADRFSPRARLRRVLITDDDKVMGEMMRERLKQEGFETELATDGESALTRLGAEDFALLLLDIQLPGMDGLDVLRRIRHDAANARLPVILVSGLDSEADVVRGFELGANDYLTKPFTPGELVARVRNLLR